MSIAIAHLGDIHIESQTDPVFDRIGQLGALIASEVENSASHLFVLVNGDWTNRGQAKEFKAAKEFVTSLRDELARRASPTPIILGTPGNHDCELVDDQAARDAVIASHADASVPPESITRIAVEPLQRCFSFLQEIGSSHLTGADPYVASLEHEVDGRKVAFTLINSAWMSMRKERPGTLHFPVSLLTELPEVAADLSITLVHHPLNWFSQPDTMRKLRDAIEARSDIVFTGHEHVPRDASVTDGTGTRVRYLEGSVLQDVDDANVSGFSVSLIDIDAHHTKHVVYEWDVQKQHYLSASERSYPLTRNPQRQDKRYRFSDAYDALLDDPGLPIVHSRTDNLRLRDFFSFPDLREYTDDSTSGKWVRIPSERFVDEVLGQAVTLITGAGKSGKTSCAKRLMVELHMRGFVPLFLSASDLRTKATPAKLKKAIATQVNRQFSNLTPEEFLLLEAGNRVIVLDDFDGILDSARALSALEQYLPEQFGHVVLLGETEACVDEYLAGQEPSTLIVSARRLDICELGAQRLTAMTRQWMTIGASEDDLDGRVTAVVQHIQQVLRASAIPHQPWIVIVLLQQADQGETVTAKNGSYGHLLQAILTFALSKFANSQIDVTSVFTLLGELAFRMYTGRRSTLDANALEDFWEYYSDKYDLPVTYSELLGDLCAAQILRSDHGETSFRARYCYSFFVAWYLHSHMHEEAAREIVRDLCGSLFHRDAADIVVFLTHLSHSPDVVSLIMSNADRLFEDAPKATFEDDVEAINGLHPEQVQMALPESAPAENRAKRIEEEDDELANRDRADADGRAVSHPEEGEVASRIVELESAFRTIDILGQILRNNSGRFEAAERERIAKCVIELAQRVLGSLLHLFSEHKEDVVKHYAPAFEHVVRDNMLVRQRVVSDADLSTMIAKRIARYVFFLFAAAGWSLVRRVASALSHEMLANTFRRLEETADSCADRMFHIGIQWERPGVEPVRSTEELHREVETNRYAETVLRAIVLEYLYLYDVKVQQKQRICNALGIKMPKGALDPGRKKLK